MKKHLNNLQKRLKPCPFCGERNCLEVVNVPKEDGTYYEDIWQVQCNSCAEEGFQAKFGFSIDKAIDKWNWRGWQSRLYDFWHSEILRKKQWDLPKALRDM